ncbi:hypothetical protein C942_03077 [Photobacterium marinum]|uniref:Transferase, hexapeptide repeat family n=1 Tax=Photobacterium marinum TaxID=1056511 RepID=L8J722_9GAMM|nr:acyltransferase [Photobacterium marinum]ELR63998.1 hypothetical protein C942_03077 [Photobacterium marinum]
MRISKALNRLYLYLRAVPKTLLFNFYYLPLSQAYKLPLLVSHRVSIEALSGSITLTDKIKTGKIKIGFGKVQVASPSRSPLLWSLHPTGKLFLGTNIKLGTGTKLDVRGELRIGNGSNFTGESTLVCNHKITFGQNNLVSWQTLFMDTDMHQIIDGQQQQLNPDAAITFGDDIWVCARSTVLKGVTLGHNSIVSANSNVVSNFEQGNAVIGGNPGRVISSMEGKTFLP